MNKFLKSQEYNQIVKIVFNSIDYKYGTEHYRKQIDTALDKLFSIKEDDLLQKESINHPISNPNS